MMWWLLWLVNLFVLSRSEISCQDATENCIKTDMKCAFLLRQIFETKVCISALGFELLSDYAVRVKGSMQLKCPLMCVEMIKKLKSTPKGKATDSCDCNSDGICLTIKARFQRCVLSSERNNTIFSCSAARKRCVNNTNCKKTQDNFLRQCTQLISGTKCTDDCKASQDELLESELGKALNECECDGLEEPYCRGIRSHYESLCKATRGPRDPEDLTTPMEQTVKKIYIKGGSNSHFGLPLWILYATITAHVFIQAIAVCLSLE